MRTRARATDLLLFDGHCAFCREQARRLAAWSRGTIELRDFQVDGALADVPGIDHAACMREMHYVTKHGDVFVNAEAAARLAMTRPLLRLFAWLYYLPVLRWALDRLYAFVARRRYALAKAKRTIVCNGDACSLHFEP